MRVRSVRSLGRSALMVRGRAHRPEAVRRVGSRLGSWRKQTVGK
jgi:hypothetical protein